MAVSAAVAMIHPRRRKPGAGLRRKFGGREGRTGRMESGGRLAISRGGIYESGTILERQITALWGKNPLRQSRSQTG